MWIELREWIGVRNEVMRGWIRELRVISQRNEQIRLRNELIRLRNGKGKLTMRGEDRLREGDGLERLA